MDVVLLKKLDRIDQFLRSFTSKNTREAYERDLRGYAAFAGASDPLSFSTLSQYRDHLIATSAPATVVRKFSAVKSFLAFLASEGVIPFNPAMNLKVPKARTIEHTEAFDDSEVTVVIDKADVNSFSGSTHRIALVLLFNLGIRRSELVNLRVGSFGEQRGKRFVTIHGKGDKSRFIPLTELVIEELNAYLMRYEEFTGESLDQKDFLLQSNRFERNDKPINPSTIYRMVKQYAKEAGVTKRVSPHSCRATMISHLLEKQVSPRCVADMAGHASINTTVIIYYKKIYALNNPAAGQVSYGC